MVYKPLDDAPTRLLESTTLDDIVRNAIIEALDSCDGNRRLAARVLDISRSRLYRLLSKYQIEKKRRTTDQQ